MGVYSFKLPDIGEGMHEGEIVKWHVKTGDKVEEDQTIVEVQNDKAVVELPSPVRGTVKEIKAAEGSVAVIGDEIVTFEVEGMAAEAGQFKERHTQARDNDATGGAADQVEHAESSLSSTTPSSAAVSLSPSAPSSPAAAATPAAAGDKSLATPSVRKLAREKGLALSHIRGTGRHGQITRDDVLAFSSGGGVPPVQADEPALDAEAAPASTEASRREEERMPLKGIRKAIAAAMVKSVYTAPHVTVMDEVDVAKLVDFREQAKPLAEKRGVKLTYLPFVVKALVAAARQFPELNATVDDEKNEIVYKKYYHIGIATDTDNGLIVPVIEDADRKSMWTIAAQIGKLAARGRQGNLAAAEMRGSTITITNIGSAGGLYFTPVINWPEVAILGIGRITDKPVVRDGFIEAGKVMALSLSFDHRIIDGATAQQAVNYMKELLANPQLLAMEV